MIREATQPVSASQEFVAARTGIVRRRHWLPFHSWRLARCWASFILSDKVMQIGRRRRTAIRAWYSRLGAEGDVADPLQEACPAMLLVRPEKPLNTSNSREPPPRRRSPCFRPTALSADQFVPAAADLRGVDLKIRRLFSAGAPLAGSRPQDRHPGGRTIFAIRLMESPGPCLNRRNY